MALWHRDEGTVHRPESPGPGSPHGIHGVMALGLRDREELVRGRWGRLKLSVMPIQDRPFPNFLGMRCTRFYWVMGSSACS
jgi:hypothetical protein